MSWDMKLAWIYYALALEALLVGVALIAMHWIIAHASALALYRMYALSTNEPPRCPTCPFRGRCPYAGGKLCAFIGKEVE